MLNWAKDETKRLRPTIATVWLPRGASHENETPRSKVKQSLKPLLAGKNMKLGPMPLNPQ